MIDETSAEWLKDEIEMVNTSLEDNLQDLIYMADPQMTGRKDIYAEALRLVSGCEDIMQVVALVNWLVSLNYSHQEARSNTHGIQ